MSIDHRPARPAGRAGRTGPDAASLTEVAPGVFAYLQPDGGWFVNNTGVVLGENQVLSIDTCATEARTRAYLAAIRTVTRQPVTTLVNTHHHGDHTNGNHLLGAQVIVAQSGCRDLLARSGGPPPPACSRRWTGGTSPVRCPPSASTAAWTCTTAPAGSNCCTSVPRRTPPTTWWPGCPPSGSCSPATSRSTAAPRSRCLGRSPAGSTCCTASATSIPRSSSRATAYLAGWNCSATPRTTWLSSRTWPARRTAAGLDPLQAAAALDLGRYARTPRLRTDRRQPAPRLRRTPRPAARLPARRCRLLRGHGRLQRRPAAALPGLTLPWPGKPGHHPA